MEIAMELIISQSTDVEQLVGQTFSTEHFGPFTIQSVDQAPDMDAICYGARDVEQGYLFLAFLPWGKALIS